MNRGFSIYLDLVRVLAALAVIVYHSNFRLLTTEKLPFSNHGHAAVIVFFVLSGYVIAYITSERENTPLSYWSSRLSRFYSLALPVVLLTPLLDMAGEAMTPQFYTGGTTTYGLAWLRILTSLTFLNEVWLVSIMSFSNVPYWSLCYEFWYYVLFAIVTFTAGRTRVLLAGAVMLLLGPKILLLAPVWVAGVVLFRWQWLRTLKPLPGALLFAASWPAYWLFHRYGMTEAGSNLLLRLVGADLHHQMAFSKFFITDYLLAVIVLANFAGMRALADIAAPAQVADDGQPDRGVDAQHHRRYQGFSHGVLPPPAPPAHAGPPCRRCVPAACGSRAASDGAAVRSGCPARRWWRRWPAWWRRRTRDGPGRRRSAPRRTASAAGAGYRR